MKWHSIFWIACFVMACGTKQESATTPPESDIRSPQFSSKKFGLTFSSDLSKDNLEQAQRFTDQLMDSVVLVTLLPECQVFDGEEQCYETSLMTTPEGDSIKSEHLSNLDQIKIDITRFGSSKTIKQKDFKKILKPLFEGDKKEQVTFCYLPRHAIAIYGPQRELTGFVELCFECSESIVALESVRLNPLSLKAMNEIGELFIDYEFNR